MSPDAFFELSYFPGCSLATTARESNQSLVSACDIMGLRLTELPDWNCCGTSSAHSLDPDLALGLAARNLSLAPEGRPMLVMCPACFKNLSAARLHLQQDPARRRTEERRWSRSINPDLEIVTFLGLLHFMDRLRSMGAAPALTVSGTLGGLRVAPYYGCMGMFPPALRRTDLPFNLLDRQLNAFGATTLSWAHSHLCCGTFLAATRPDVATPLTNRIMRSAMEAGAECLVTACAMCQLNLEIRCTLARKIPTLHFSEIIALVLGAKDYDGWFRRHIVDPRPLLRDKSLIA